MLKIKDDYKWLFIIFIYVCFWLLILCGSNKVGKKIENDGLKSIILPIWEGK